MKCALGLMSITTAESDMEIKEHSIDGYECKQGQH